MTAFHEAGHAVVGLIFQDPIESLTIQPKDQALGFYKGAMDRLLPSFFNPEKFRFSPVELLRYRTGFEWKAMTALAGIAAEVIRDPVAHENLDLRDDHGGYDDVASVVDGMQYWDPPNSEGLTPAALLGAKEAWLEALFARAKRLLKRKAVWLAVEYVAEELVRHTTLSDSQLTEVNRKLRHRLRLVIRDVLQKYEADQKRLEGELRRERPKKRRTRSSSSRTSTAKRPPR